MTNYYVDANTGQDFICMYGMIVKNSGVDSQWPRRKLFVDEQFTCARCHGQFIKDWTDEEAAEEARAIWGEDHPTAEHMAIVCEDCFSALGQEMTER